VSWVLGLVEHDDFATFFETTLSNGAAVFALDLKYPRNSTLEEWAVRFIGGYESDYLDGMWQVSAALDLVRRTIVTTTADWSEFLVYPEESGIDNQPFTVDGDRPFHVMSL
jgi:hypothetical protein